MSSDDYTTALICLTHTHNNPLIVTEEPLTQTACISRSFVLCRIRFPGHVLVACSRRGVKTGIHCLLHCLLFIAASCIKLCFLCSSVFSLFYHNWTSFVMSTTSEPASVRQGIHYFSWFEEIWVSSRVCYKCPHSTMQYWWNVWSQSHREKTGAILDSSCLSLSNLFLLHNICVWSDNNHRDWLNILYRGFCFCSRVRTVLIQL